MTNERIIELFEIATHKKIRAVEGGYEFAINANLVAQVNLNYMKTVVRSYIEDKVAHFKYLATKAKSDDYSLANQRLADCWQSKLEELK